MVLEEINKIFQKAPDNNFTCYEEFLEDEITSVDRQNQTTIKQTLQMV